MTTSLKFDVDENGAQVDNRIDSLFYLTTVGPIFCLCAHFQACPKEFYLSAVKRIFRYFIGTKNLRLWYPKGTHT